MADEAEGTQTKPGGPASGSSCCLPVSGRRGLEGVQEVVAPRSSAVSGMVDLPGGEFLMGSDDAHSVAADGEGPVRAVTVLPFRMDATPVTNAEFGAFIRETGYTTEAERFGWSFVFWSQIRREDFRRVVEDTVAQAPWWCKVPGAAWQRPFGPESDVRDREDHPAVHVSWNDAAAYAAWAGKRLPSEAEWEYAGRGGLEQKLFPWGDELVPGGVHCCNVWQGRFPYEDTAQDGFAGTCPVRTFPPNAFGLSSVVGNVWEWCADDFAVRHEQRPVATPEPGGKVMKGGSFLCHASYCNRYRVAGRTQNSPDSSASNVGFRCAADPRPSLF